MVLADLAIFFAASIILVKSASIAVRSVSGLGIRLKMSPFFISFVLAGLVAILPELFIGINSSLSGVPSMGIGTIIGSNIADMTIVIGIVALAGRKIKVDKKTISNNAYFVIITILPIILMSDGALTRDDGLILIFAFLYYFSTIIRKEKLHIGKAKRDKLFWKHILMFAASMIVLFASAHFMVDTGKAIAFDYRLPEALIGLLLLAIGTTLPELTFSVKAALARHKEIALGDIMGNVAIDSTLSIGVIAIISPVSNNFLLMVSSSLFMILGALVVVTLMQAGREITWQESFLLFYMYAMFLAIEILMKGSIGF